MATIDLLLKRKENLTFEVPNNFAYKDFFKRGREKHQDIYRVKISYPMKRRTTGKKSQNHRIAFLCNLIAAECSGIEGMSTYQQVKDLAKLRAIKRGYPYRWIKFIRPDGQPGENLAPFHEDEIDTVQAGFLNDELEQMTAEMGIDIPEYVE